jgi:hypothetical protein
MTNIKKWDEFINESKSNNLFTKEEIEYLWKKIEFNKKKKAIDTENELYKLLNSGKTSFNDEEIFKILNALEYSFKKKLKDGTIKTELGQAIHNKLPSDWLGVKFSVLKAKEIRDEKEKSVK